MLRDDYTRKEVKIFVLEKRFLFTPNLSDQSDIITLLEKRKDKKLKQLEKGSTDPISTTEITRFSEEVIFEILQDILTQLVLFAIKKGIRINNKYGNCTIMFNGTSQ